MTFGTLSVSSRALAMTKEEFQDLKVLDSGAIASAIERFQVQIRHENYAEGSLTCRYPYMLPVLGYAVTLKVRPATPGTRGRHFFESNEWWDILLAVPAPRILVLQDMDRHPGAGALIGDMQACVLKTLDCVGAITNGAVCDVSRIEGLDFQMFSGAVNVAPVSSHLVSVGGPVQIGSLEISHGDLIHGDGNGIVRIPRELVRRIPATAAALRKKNEAVMDFCRSDDFTIGELRELLAEQ